MVPGNKLDRKKYTCRKSIPGIWTCKLFPGFAQITHPEIEPLPVQKPRSFLEPVYPEVLRN